MSDVYIDRLDGINSRLVAIEEALKVLNAGTSSKPSATSLTWKQPTQAEYDAFLTKFGVKEQGSIPAVNPGDVATAIEYARFGYNLKGDAGTWGEYYQKAWKEANYIKSVPSQLAYSATRYALNDPDFAIFGCLTGLWPLEYSFVVASDPKFWGPVTIENYCTTQWSISGLPSGDGNDTTKK